MSGFSIQYSDDPFIPQSLDDKGIHKRKGEEEIPPVPLRRGFQIEFKNGWTVSVQFGPHNYCANRTFMAPRKVDDPNTCRNAEVAVLRPDGNFWRWDPSKGDDVAGQVTPDEVASIIAMVAARTPADDAIEEIAK